MEFFALHLPKSTWVQLADIAHLHPERDFALPWFLPYCYDGQAAPEGSLVRKCAGLEATNVNDYLKVLDIPWAVVKGMRNRLVHEYFDIRLDVVWETVEKDVPALVSQLEGMVEAEDDDGES